MENVAGGLCGGDSSERMISISPNLQQIEMPTPALALT